MALRERDEAEAAGRGLDSRLGCDTAVWDRVAAARGALEDALRAAAEGGR